MKPKIVIIGAGGHGKVVCDAILDQNKYEIAGFLDDNVPVGEFVTNDYKIIGEQKNIASLKSISEFFIVSIGKNEVREKIYDSIKSILKPATIIHPSVLVGSNVKIGAGTVVLANVVINSYCNVGENAIINAGVVIDHDNKIGNHTHLSIGTLVGSNSEIADGYVSLIGEKINSFSKID